MNKIYRLCSCLVLLLGLAACNESEYEIDNLIPGEYNKILYLQQYGEKGLTLSRSETTTELVSVIKSGSNPKAEAAVNITVMSQETIDKKWSNLTGMPYLLLPENCYTLSETSLQYASEDMFKDVTVTFDTGNVETFINEKKAESPEEAEYMKFVLPVEAKGVTPADSVNSQKSYVLFMIEKIKD